MTAFVHAPDLTLDWPAHVFPVGKYALVRGKLDEACLRAEPASDDDLVLVHPRAYLDRLEALTRNPKLGYAEFEVPVTRRTVDAFRAMTGGSILAGRRALEEGGAGNIGGGFHHAFADRGEGFCLLNDLAVLVRVLRRDGRIRRACIVDCDVHQGNGTAKIFEGDESAWTFSIHQENNYPLKQRSDLDIGLRDGCPDDEYLSRLEEGLRRSLDASKPDLAVYQAGADPFEGDVLGGLAVTKEGLAARDRLVYAECRRRGLPVVVTLGGGYAENPDDVVDIHVTTLRLLNQD